MCNDKPKTRKEDAIHFFEVGCQQMAELVNNHLFEGCADIHWIGDRYDLCDFSGEWWLTPDEMRQILESGLSAESFYEWWNYNLHHAYTPINLSSWIMGLRPEYDN